MARPKRFPTIKTTWELAEALHKMPNVPLIIHANNHEYKSNDINGTTHVLLTGNKKNVRVGNFDPEALEDSDGD